MYIHVYTLYAMILYYITILYYIIILQAVLHPGCQAEQRGLCKTVSVK